MTESTEAIDPAKMTDEQRLRRGLELGCQLMTFLLDNVPGFRWTITIPLSAPDETPEFQARLKKALDAFDQALNDSVTLISKHIFGEVMNAKNFPAFSGIVRLKRDGVQNLEFFPNGVTMDDPDAARLISGILGFDIRQPPTLAELELMESTCRELASMMSGRELPKTV